MKKFLTTLILFSLFSAKAFAVDTPYLIQEMEKLRDSLTLDDPARIDLTLRLADLYFDVSIKEGGEGDFKVLKKNRMKALELYKHSLNGTDGVQKAEGLTRLKIQFQLARLLSRLDEFKQAEKYYLIVQSHPKVPTKMKEQSSLALAEWYEEDAKYKKSKLNYDLAIKLCKTRTACNYAHYRKAWLFFKDTKLDEAITEMRASLWSSDTEIRESSLQDLMLFMSNQNTDGLKELQEIKGLAKKLKRPELVHKIAEAFYVAGNRKAGSNLLAYINEQEPSLYFEVRLLEEVYGFRNWDRVEKFLTTLEKRSSADIPTKKDHAEEVQKILRRYLVQVDAEANVAPDLNPFLKRSIDIYLAIYPNDDLRKKLQQGWIKAEDSSELKVKRIGRWIKEDTAYGFKPEHIRKLRQTRLSLAQKLGQSDIVIEDSLAIAELLKGTPAAEEFEYVAAREYYSQKNFAKAEPIFKKLVSAESNKVELGKWALLSQNLLLDIYNGQDAYEKIMSQVASWKALTKDTADKKLAKENKLMDQLSIDAKFAHAAKMKDDPKSLETFYNFCFQGIKVEKSCANAKVLAVKAEDQEKIIKLLEREKDENALVSEYELMGRFSDAAKLQEKLNLKKQGRKAPHELYLKIALLYELDQNLKNRDRILKLLVRKIKREKAIPSELEDAIFLTLNEAALINDSSLFLPWSLKRKLRLATKMEQKKPSRVTQKLILGQEKSQGPVWSRLILKKVQKDFYKIGKISFYGRYSKSRFKRRTKAINKFVKTAKAHLNGADLETRVYLLHMLERTYGQMGEDILSTPLPKGLDEATMANVQIQLQTMSAPFDTVRADYDKLLQEHLAQLKPETLARVQKSFETKIKDYSVLVPLEEIEERKVVALEMEKIKEQHLKLHKEPTSREVLGGLLSYYKEKQHPRLAAYFTGRLESLEIKK